MSSFLLDTHTWIWMLEDSPRLRPRTRELILDEGHELLLSVASVWEIAMKRSRGMIDLPLRTEAEVRAQLDVTRVDAVPVEPGDAVAAGALPPHHRDPFDRMIVAQAQRRGVAILTVDPSIAAYDVDVIAN